METERIANRLQATTGLRVGLTLDDHWPGVPEPGHSADGNRHKWRSPPHPSRVRPFPDESFQPTDLDTVYTYETNKEN
jgi:hypothetical protein